MILYPPADIVAAFLKLRGVAVYPEDFKANPPPPVGTWPVVTDSMPDQAGNDNYITVYETGARQDGRNYRNGDRVEFPTVQVKVRGKDDDTAKTKGREIQALLLKVGGQSGQNGMLGPVTVTIDTGDGAKQVTVLSAFASPLTPLVQEEKNKRRVYVLNARLTLED